MFKIITFISIIYFTLLINYSSTAEEVVKIKWTNLRVHFSLNPLSKYYYQRQPRELSNLSPSSGWINLSGSDCRNGGKYAGFRYIQKSSITNPSSGGTMVLLFDVNGIIAGIQMILDKSQIESNNNDYHFSKVHYYNLDKFSYYGNNNKNNNVYILTAYFINPTLICTTGRTQLDLRINGTGSEIHIQNGPTPANYMVIPRHSNIALNKGWSKHRCAIGQGIHYFYKMNQVSLTNCTESPPIFALYNNHGDGIGFGFVATGRVTSPHFENLPTNAISTSLGPSAPKCILEKASSPGLTTMHIWFTDYPNFYTCL